MTTPRGSLHRLALVGVLAVLVAAVMVLQVRTAVPLAREMASVDIKATQEPVALPSTAPPAVQAGPGQTGVAVPVSTTGEQVAAPADFAARPTQRAAVMVDVTEQDEAGARAVLAGLEGVEHVAGLSLTATTLGGIPADIAQVDPDEFRPFTPPATANHQPLWDRVAAGDVAVTHEFGTVHEVPLGSRLATGLVLPTGQALALRVGALASNGTPPVADAIVLTDSLPDEGTRRLLVGLAPEASPTATAEALEDAGFTAEVIPDPRLPRSDTVVPAGGITPENVWDHLALCESSGDWQINTGNGYYGGVQFLPESWAGVGGQGLPHEHTREEQIYRASLLWQIQGWEAWPQCARKLGLIVDPPPQPTPAPAEPVRTESPE